MGKKTPGDKLDKKVPTLDEEYFRSFLEDSPLPVFIIGVEDPDPVRHTFLAANAAARKMYGYSEEELRSMTASSLHPADERKMVMKAVKTADRTSFGRIRNPFPFRHILKDGKTIFVQVNAHPISYMKSPARLVIVHDISDQLRAETDLKESAVQYRLVFDAQADAVMIFSRDGFLVDANQSARRMYRYRKNEIYGLHMKDLVQSDFHHLLEKIRSVLEARKTFRGHSINVRRDGTLMDVEVRVSRIDYAGEPHALVVARDVTSTKETERRLRESRDHLRALYRASPDMIFLHGEDGMVIDVNRNVLREYGAKSIREFIETKPDRLIGGGCTVEMAMERLKKALEGENQQFQWNSRRLDGTEFPSEVRLRRVTMPGEGNGKRRCVVAVVRNISDLQETERSLNEAYAKLEQKNKDMESFLYSAGHDLRTPLVSIKGYLELLMRSAQEKLTEDEKQMCTRINGNVDRLNDLLKDLLQLSRIGVLDGEPRRLQISSVVNRILEGEKENGGPMPVSVDIQKDIPDIFLHEVRAYQLFRNLISNSLKFQSEKRPLRIAIGCSPDEDAEVPEGHRIFFLRDNGVGIVKEDHDMIFGLFSRPDDSRASGTGVGLAIVKRVVEEEGGKLWVESTPDKETTFHFSLPVCDE